MPIYHATIRQTISESRIAQDGRRWIRLRGDDNWYYQDDPRIAEAFHNDRNTYMDFGGIALVDFNFTGLVS